MYRQIEVQPAKSSKSTCKNCKTIIEKGELRARVVDDRAFREYARKNPGCKQGEGYSRGYFETQNGSISIDKYYVHLKCYRPIHPHPKKAQYFKLVGAKAADKQAFTQWLSEQEYGGSHQVQEKKEPRGRKPANKRGRKKAEE